MEWKAAGDEHNIHFLCLWSMYFKECGFSTPEFSQLLQVLLVSLSFLLVCTFVKSNDMSSHVELQSSEFDLNNRNIQTVNRGETLADFTFRLIHPKLQFWNMWPQTIFIALLNAVFAV